MKWLRLMVAAVALAALAWAAWALRTGGPGAVPVLPGCLLRRYTGLSCPGCGMTRATHAALNGDFGRAFEFNPLGLVLLPLALFGLVPEVLGWIMNRPPPWRLQIGGWTARAVTALVVVFWVVRNLPFWPYRL